MSNYSSTCRFNTNQAACTSNTLCTWECSNGVNNCSCTSDSTLIIVIIFAVLGSIAVAITICCCLYRNPRCECPDDLIGGPRTSGFDSRVGMNEPTFVVATPRHKMIARRPFERGDPFRIDPTTYYEPEEYGGHPDSKIIERVRFHPHAIYEDDVRVPTHPDYNPQPQREDIDVDDYDEEEYDTRARGGGGGAGGYQPRNYLARGGGGGGGGGGNNNRRRAGGGSRRQVHFEPRAAFPREPLAEEQEDEDYYPHNPDDYEESYEEMHARVAGARVPPPPPNFMVRRSQQ